MCGWSAWKDSDSGVGKGDDESVRRDVSPEDPRTSLGFYTQEARHTGSTYLAYVKGWIYTAANVHDDVCPDVLVIKKKVRMFAVMNTAQGGNADRVLPGWRGSGTFLWATFYFRGKK